MIFALKYYKFILIKIYLFYISIFIPLISLFYNYPLYIKTLIKYN
jgi:hypothetical protein